MFDFSVCHSPLQNLAKLKPETITKLSKLLMKGTYNINEACSLRLNFREPKGNFGEVSAVPTGCLQNGRALLQQYMSWVMFLTYFGQR